MGSAKVPGSAREADLIRMMEQHGDRLVGLCAGLLQDSALAQDMVQETFIRAYQHMDRFRGQHEGSEKAWLTRIAINLCRDQQRSRWFRFIDRSVSYDMLPERGESAEDTSSQLYAAVQQLPMKYREVILLHYYQDLQVCEIAQALGLNVSSVYRRLDKAREKLKTKLERWDFG